MNKIKLMYDVVKTMKAKDAFEGTLKVEAMKGQTRIFSFDNTFEKNNATGQIKAKTLTEVDCQGKKMKLENSINLEMPGSDGFDCCIKRMHSKHMSKHHEANCCGIKDGLSKIVFVLGILNSIKAEEQEDKSVVLSLELADIPEDLKKAVCEHIKCAETQHEGMDCCKEHHMCMKEFHSMEKANFKFKVFINKDNEIEKVTLEATGEKTCEKGEKHDMKLTAELCLNW